MKVMGMTDRPRILPLHVNLQKALQVTGDVISSVNAGGGRAAIGLAGLEGDLRKCGTDGVANIAERTGLATPQQAARMRATGDQARRVVPGVLGVQTPTIQEIIQSLPASTRRGVQYVPRTVPGKYGRTVGEFATNALVPGSAVVRAASVLGPAAASETAGQATEETRWEAPARFAGGLAGAGVTGAVLRASGVPMRPQIDSDFEYKPYTVVDRAFDSIEDLFGEGAVERPDPRSFQFFNQAVREGNPDGRMQIRFDLDGHGYDPHFHIQNRPPRGRQVDLTPSHHNSFRKE